MHVRTHRLRRVAAAIALGLGGVGSVVGVAANAAGAATTSYTATIKATTVAKVTSTHTGTSAGDLTITLPADVGSTAITLALSSTRGTVKWATATVSHSAGSSSTVTAGTGTGTLKITVVNPAAGANTLHVTGITYDLAGVYGTVTVTPSATPTSATVTVVFSPTSVVNASAPAVKVHVTANTPAVTIAPGASESISPISFEEHTAGAVPAGYVCIALSPTATTSNVFLTSATGTAKVTTGDGVVTPATVTYESAAGTPVTTGTAGYARFTVKTTSTIASTYEVSGLAVKASTTGGAVTAVVTSGTAAKCKTDTGTIGSAVAYSIAVPTTQVYGATADATAVAEFERAFPYTTGTKCPTSRAAVIATTKVYQDALSSQYLAQYEGTGTLLTPTTALSTETTTALRKEGIDTVYVVGGPLAVTTTVEKAIAALHPYKCGGTTLTATTTTMTVDRIYGQTQYGTAEDVAEYVGIKATASKTFRGAYATTNATGGSGLYNDTAGSGTTAPSSFTKLPTAILASGQEFQDAQAASVVSYHTKIPMLLTTATTLSTTAVAAMTDLHIKQVILMGGELAVTNTVEKALVTKLGVSVLRVAGKNYTDTARELADFESNTATTLGLGWTAKGLVMVARGNGFTDGLAGAVLDSTHNAATGSSHEHPLLLTLSPEEVGTYLTTFLETSGTGGAGIDKITTKKISSLTILGGPLSVTSAEISAMETDLKH